MRANSGVRSSIVRAVSSAQVWRMVSRRVSSAAAMASRMFARAVGASVESAVKAAAAFWQAVEMMGLESGGGMGCCRGRVPSVTRCASDTCPARAGEGGTVVFVVRRMVARNC